jgi:plastocyanin
MRSLVLLFLLAPAAASAATLSAQVRNPRGAAVADAVVYAVPEKPLPLAKKTAIMDQKNRMFVPHILPIQTGTSVRFPNSDDIRHQVYSFSPAKTFQLPLYKGTPANPIFFERPGVATLGCNIHDRMSAYIVVVDTPFFAMTGRDGTVTLDNLAAGKYTVHVWYADMRTEPKAVPVTLTGAERGEVSFSTTR